MGRTNTDKIAIDPNDRYRVDFTGNIQGSARQSIDDGTRRCTTNGCRRAQDTGFHHIVYRQILLPEPGNFNSSQMRSTLSITSFSM